MLETVSKLEKEERLAASRRELYRLLDEGLDDIQNGRVCSLEEMLEKTKPVRDKA